MLGSSKNLYISCGKESKALYAKVNCAATEDAVTQKKAILVVNLAEYGTEIGTHRIDEGTQIMHSLNKTFPSRFSKQS